jgi:lipopolysaccharide/colanic/teichoic acid biosynthesis glycosyltransferase
VAAEQFHLWGGANSLPLAQLRNTVGLPASGFTIGFVGRFTRDKGIADLIAAFHAVRATHDTSLLLVGDFEGGDPVSPELRQQIENDPQIIQTGFVEDPTPYYFLMDVLVLPTLREGFPTVALEAQAAGKPVVTTTATGAVDSIIDGVTGIHVPPQDPQRLQAAIETLMRDPDLARRMGAAGRERVLAEYDQRRVWSLAMEFYRTMQRSATRQRGLVLFAKRVFDYLLSGGLLIALAPLIACVALLIRMLEGAPVIFKQQRLGRRGKEFEILKFRTMTPGPDPAVTRLGAWLRTLSLDELPQLWNVLRGEVSLVGPRPLLPQYRDRYDAEQFRRHNVLPGITGWAQVNGRNAIGWEEKFKLDVWYVDHWSLWLDAKILFLTVIKVFRREGISQPGHEGAAEFMGPTK